jgi:hypothetical protein
MNNYSNILLFLALSFLFANQAVAQENKGSISGNFEIISQAYTSDSSINAVAPDDVLRNHAYANIIYTRGKFSAGLRYEAYMNALLGYDERYNGHGIAHRYAKYAGDILEITAGHFYEQFGNGLVLRAYEDKTLGYDNAIDGFRVLLKPMPGIKITGLAGKQRKYWEYAQGTLRAADAEIDIKTAFKNLYSAKTRLILGGSFVSKYEPADDPVYNFPENTAAFSGRMSVSHGFLNFSSEYAHKINDPSNDNNYIFKPGNALFINTSYSGKGIGILLSAQRLDNMSFRSERSATLADAKINYLPSLATTHTYSLMAMYPFAVQDNGQIGASAELYYNFKRKSVLGGKYGTSISLNFSQVNSIQKTPIVYDPAAEQVNLDGYTSDFFAAGDELYFRDINISLEKKVHRNFKFNAAYMYQEYNKAVLEGTDNVIVNAHIAVLDMTYMPNFTHAFRLELQNLHTKQDKGDWAQMTFEYTLSPKWFVAVSDQYNYGNSDPDKRNHYFYTSAGYTQGASRIELGYGKQRAGIICIGGVCRNVPASNGLSLRISTSF